MPEHGPSGGSGAGNVGNAGPVVPQDVVPDWARRLSVPSSEYLKLAEGTAGENVVLTVKARGKNVRVDQLKFTDTHLARELLWLEDYATSKDRRWGCEPRSVRKFMQRIARRYNGIYGITNIQCQVQNPDAGDDVRVQGMRTPPILIVTNAMMDTLEAAVEQMEKGLSLKLLHGCEELSTVGKSYVRVCMTELSKVDDVWSSRNRFDCPEGWEYPVKYPVRKSGEKSLYELETVMANIFGDAVPELVELLENTMKTCEWALFADMMKQNPFAAIIVADFQELYNSVNAAREEFGKAQKAYDAACPTRSQKGKPDWDDIRLKHEAMTDREVKKKELETRLKQSESVSHRLVWAGQMVHLKRKVIWQIHQNRLNSKVVSLSSLGIQSVIVQEEVEMEEAGVEMEEAGVMDVVVPLDEKRNGSEEDDGVDSDTEWTCNVSTEELKKLAVSTRCLRRTNTDSTSDEKSDINGWFGDIVTRDERGLGLDEVVFTVITTHDDPVKISTLFGHCDGLPERVLEVKIPDGRVNFEQMAGVETTKCAIHVCMQCKGQCTCGYEGHGRVDKWVQGVSVETNLPIVVQATQLSRMTHEDHIARYAAGKPPKDGSGRGPVEAAIDAILKHNKPGDTVDFEMVLYVGLKEPFDVRTVVVGYEAGQHTFNGRSVNMQELRENMVIRNMETYVQTAESAEYQVEGDILIAMGQLVHADEEETRQLKRAVVRTSEGQFMLKPSTNSSKQEFYELTPSSETVKKLFRRMKSKDNERTKKNARRSENARMRRETSRMQGKVGEWSIMRPVDFESAAGDEPLKKESEVDNKPSNPESAVPSNPESAVNDERLDHTQRVPAVDVDLDTEEQEEVDALVAQLNVAGLTLLLKHINNDRSHYDDLRITDMTRKQLSGALLHPELGCLSRKKCMQRYGLRLKAKIWMHETPGKIWNSKIEWIYKGLTEQRTAHGVWYYYCRDCLDPNMDIEVYTMQYGDDYKNPRVKSYRKWSESAAGAAAGAAAGGSSKRAKQNP